MRMRFAAFHSEQISKSAAIPPKMTIRDRERFAKDSICLILHVYRTLLLNSYQPRGLTRLSKLQALPVDYYSRCK